MTKTRSTRISACAALAMATASIASTSNPSIAAAQERDRVWALDCTLSDGTEQALKQGMNDAGLERLTGERQVALVVIYSFQDNGGQELTAGGFTGPLICRAPGVNIDQVVQTDDIGTPDDPVNVLDVEHALILRYQKSGPPLGPAEIRYCHSVDADKDPDEDECFRVF